MLIRRSISEPKRINLSWDEKWKSHDQGLVICWERGREKALEEPDLANRAKNGELVILAWKGGVEKAIKAKQKYGTLNYLATWQGLRGEDLSIDPDTETRIVCTRTNVTVIFTSDSSKYNIGYSAQA